MPPQWLAAFRDLFAVDTTMLRLHALLAEASPATRTNHTRAAAKLHVVMNVLQGTASQVKLTSERTSDLTPWQRKVLDVEVEVAFPRRAYLGRRSQARRSFRLVALRHEETASSQVSLTNVPPDHLAAEDVREVDSLRWQVELLFRAIQSCGRLEVLPSRNPAVSAA